MTKEQLIMLVDLVYDLVHDVDNIEKQEIPNTPKVVETPAPKPQPAPTPAPALTPADPKATAKEEKRQKELEASMSNNGVTVTAQVRKEVGAKRNTGKRIAHPANPVPVIPLSKVEEAPAPAPAPKVEPESVPAVSQYTAPAEEPTVEEESTASVTIPDINMSDIPDWLK